MELTPQALHDVEFREARRNGYNTRDVDDFLERVAVGVGQLQDRLRDAYHRAEAAEARLADMQRQIDDLQRRGPEREASPSDADETLRRTLVLAQRTADATIKEAQDEANRVLAEARGEAARTRASADAESARVRASAESEALRDARAEVDHLSATREALLQDIDVLEQHLEEQRNQIRDGLSELQRLVDDPGTLRMDPPPKVTDVTMQPHQPLGHELSGNGNLSTNGSSLVEQAALDASAGLRGHDEADDNGRSVNDGSVVAALQELHLSDPGHDDEAPTQQQEALPPRDLFPPPSEPLPQRDPLAAREPLAQREPLPQRDPLPQREPLPQRDAFPAPGDPLPPREAFPAPGDPLPPREAFPAPGDPLPPREAFPAPGDPLSPREAFPPPNEPLPQREPFPPPGELPQREPFPPPGEPLPQRESLPPREPLPQRDVLPQREPLPQREALPAREPLPQREPPGSRDDLPQRASFPAASQPPPGTTGFLPDLRAAFDPPEPDAGPGRNDDDAGLLPIDAPPPPPPPPGFEHLQGAGGIPIEPGSRPSEWGRGVFDTEEDEDPAQGARFGRRH